MDRDGWGCSSRIGVAGVFFMSVTFRGTMDLMRSTSGKYIALLAIYHLYIAYPEKALELALEVRAHLVNLVPARRRESRPIRLELHQARRQLPLGPLPRLPVLPLAPFEVVIADITRHDAPVLRRAVHQPQNALPAEDMSADLARHGPRGVQERLATDGAEPPCFGAGV